MSPNKNNNYKYNQTRYPQARPGMAKMQVIFIIGAVVTFALVIGLAIALTGENTDKTKALTYTIKKGRVTISISESGTIRSREQNSVKSEVAGRATILTVVPEGTRVKKGELLIELDASKLEDQIVDQEIRVQNAESSSIAAKTNYDNTIDKAKSDITAAELKLKFAEIDEKKYKDAEYPNQLEQADIKIKFAEAELSRAHEKYAGSERLAKKGFITKLELSADKLSFERRESELKVVKMDKELLEQYTHTRKLEELESDADQAKNELARIERKAASDIQQAKANLNARENEYKRQQDKYNTTNEQIAKCKIIAPVDGMVVYAGTVNRRPWQQKEPLSEGQEVYERQELIVMTPERAPMSVDVQVHESKINKIKIGQAATITVDAVENTQLTGTVSMIAQMAEQTRWFSNTKVYTTEIHIDGTDERLKPGMSCTVDIIVDDLQNVISLPMQSVFRINGQHACYLLKNGKRETCMLKTGLDNNIFIHVISGLEEGDEVLLNPPLQPSMKQEGDNNNESANKNKQSAKSNTSTAEKKSPTGKNSADKIDRQSRKNRANSANQAEEKQPDSKNQKNADASPKPATQTQTTN